ncbi:MAG: hypothetical protein DELT_00641 [Desulfovibrio sp.]
MPAVCLIFFCIACGCIAAAGFLFSAPYLGESFPAPLDVIKGAAVAFLLIRYIPRQFTRHLENLRPDLLYLRPMTFWALMVAFSLGLLASGMAYTTGTSERVIFGGWLVATIAAFSAFAAFFGTLRPSLFSGAIYLGLLCVWLIVPTAGMEAYMYAEGISPHSPYAATGWKWTYGFCTAAGFSAIRLLILRQDLLRDGAAKKGVQEALDSFIEEKTEK